MSCRLLALCFDANAPATSRALLGGVLGGRWQATTPKITWSGPPLMPKTGKNRLHFDLAPPVHGDQQAEVDRLVSLGATRIDIGQSEVSWAVMADPDGHEFWVLTRR